MPEIVICSQCGFQTEADKRFCPNCGAPIDSSIHTHQTASPRQAAASTLFSRLKKKREGNSNNSTQEPVSSVNTIPTMQTILEDQKGDTTRRFQKKPLGVSRSTQRAKVTAPVSPLSKDMKSQLIQFLRELNKLDRTLEASAVVRTDGTLLASAHSSRAKPEMMATISSTLYSIAKDSVHAISGGKMRMVTITAENSVLMLTGIDTNTVLILVTSPKSNLGLISMYSELVAQNIAKFLAKLA
ncbi:MAG: roadblock/LC7 domain-containing protein [Candidatus Helarchaeota archaeon]